MPPPACGSYWACSGIGEETVVLKVYQWFYLCDKKWPFKTSSGSVRKRTDASGVRVQTATQMNLKAAFFCALAVMPAAQAQDAASLRARFTALSGPLASNQFQRPIALESSENKGEIKGDVYALVQQPYALVGPALQGMEHWCDILILHLNVKRCRASTPAAGETLSLNIGRKYDQPLADTHLFEFLYAVAKTAPDYLQVVMHADEGPYGTSGYRIVLEAVALDAGRSFIHMSYACTYGLIGRLAMRGYLMTTGRGKVGFSVTGTDASGAPIYMDGMRGVMERNTMRYYLAIEAYLGALSAPPAQQLEKRLNDWHAGIERYPIQLHEQPLDDYLEMKHKEIRRQQTAAAN